MWNSSHINLCSNDVEPTFERNQLNYFNFSTSQPSLDKRRVSTRVKKAANTGDYYETESLILDGDRSPGTLINIHWKLMYCYTPKFRNGAKYYFVVISLSDHQSVSEWVCVFFCLFVCSPTPPKLQTPARLHFEGWMILVCKENVLD